MRKLIIFFTLISLFIISCSKKVEIIENGTAPENIYQIKVNNNQVGYEIVKRDRVGDTLVLTSFQKRPFRLRPISYDSKLILVPGYATWQIASYRSFEQLPGQKITIKLRFEKPWLILLQNSVVSSPRYWNSDPKDPDGPSIIEWDKAFLLEALINRYNLKDTVFEKVQDIPVIIPSAFGERGIASVELLEASNDTAEFRIVYHREIELDSLNTILSEDSVWVSIRAVMPSSGIIGKLLQARVYLPSFVTVSIIEDENAETSLPEPLIRIPEVEGYKIEDHKFTGTDGVSLAGSFYIPEEEEELLPGILLLHTNMATDRYEMGVFRNLADKLVRNKFIVFSYDKRGVGESEGSYDSLHYGLIAGDAYAALEELMNCPGVDIGRVFIVGHGEGGLIALDIASDQQYKDKLAGIITLGTTSLNPIDSGNIELLTLQAKTWGWSNERLEKQIDDLKEGLEILRNSNEYWADIPGFPGEKENLAYARSFLDFNPIEKVRNSDVPILIIHGEEDNFVSSENAKKLFLEAIGDTLNPRRIAEMIVLPGIDANFAFPTIEGKDGYRESFQLTEHIEGVSLSSEITNWINRLYIIEEVNDEVIVVGEE